MNDFKKFLIGHIDVSWWIMLLIGFVVLAVNFGIFILCWYVRYCIAVEIGYPKRKKGYIKKRVSPYSFPEKLLLVRLALNADTVNPMTFINLVGNFANILSYICCWIGFFGCMITLTDAWCLTMLTVLVVCINCIMFGIEFIPDLIWVPSERRRYISKRKK